MSFANRLDVAAPSPTPSNTSANGTKRKREGQKAEVFSTPQSVGTGQYIGTQYTYVTEHLKDGMKKMTFEEIMQYLNVGDEARRLALKQMFHSADKSSRIAFDPKLGKYHYKSIYPIENPSQLKAYLQAQKSWKGIAVKDLKDGWPSVAEDVKKMADKNLIMLKLTKDGAPKMIWDNDPSLIHDMELQFMSDWHKIAIPANPDELRNTLTNVGLNVATAPRLVIDNTVKTKKKRAPRKNGKVTNDHMKHKLMDFGALRK
ncbi:hypothetical protein E8E13_001076 [Curvularia kusanoi]|uniref:Transcription initiation factor IIE subunit beta n=1 Tax=Curvularia kusanoi TaxID=90978 RepID=A0A9P4T4M9_CURKU|nr:hypothetical protein E8E13_001076 [Curvularia kusanoi]